MQERVLISDDLDTLKIMGLTPEQCGFRIGAGAGGEGTLAKAFSEKSDAILLDRQPASGPTHAEPVDWQQVLDG